MVKKSSFLDKLFGGHKTAPTKADSRKTPSARERKPAPSGRKVADPGLRRDKTPAVARADSATDRAADLRPDRGTSRLEGLATEPRSRAENGSSTKANKPVEVAPIVEAPRVRKKEDAATALVDGFKDLSGLLHGIQDRMDEQTRRTGDLNSKFHDLPEVARAQIEFMGKISEQVVSQEERTRVLAERLSGLPELLDGLHKTLEKQLEREERTEHTLTEFRGTMDRIHQSIGKLSHENQVAMSTAVESFERSQETATSAFSEAQKMAHETISQNQDVHLKQINDLVDRTTRANKNMVWLMVMVLGALIVLFIAVLNS